MPRIVKLPTFAMVGSGLGRGRVRAMPSRALQGRARPMTVRAAAVELANVANMQLGNSMRALHNIIESQRLRHYSKEAAWYSDALALVDNYIRQLEHHAFLEGFGAYPVMNARQNRNMRNMHLKLIKVSRIVKKHGLITAANATKINKNHSSALQAINSLARLRGALAGRVAALTGRRR